MRAHFWSSPLQASLVALALLCLPSAESWASPPLEAAHQLVQEARQLADRGQPSEALTQLEKAAKLLEKELGATHPIDSPKLRELVRGYRQINERLLQGYRDTRQEEAIRERYDRIMTLLEGRLQEAHRYATDLVQEIARDYHEVVLQRLKHAREQGQDERIEELGDRFLGVVESLLGATHSGNQQWLRPLLESYSRTIRKRALELEQAGRKEDLRSLLGRAETTLTGALGKDHRAVQEVRQAQIQLEKP